MANPDSDKDDVEPTGEDAEAQREATVMPWVWGAVGVLVIAALIAWMVFVKPAAPPPAAPLHSLTEAPATH